LDCPIFCYSKCLELPNCATRKLDKLRLKPLHIDQYDNFKFLWIMSANLLYPAMIWAGETKVSSVLNSPLFQLPQSIWVLNYLAIEHWLVDWLIYRFRLQGIYYFLFIAWRKLSMRKTAFNASIVLLASIGFGVSRKIMQTHSACHLIIRIVLCLSILKIAKFLMYLPCT